MAERAAYALLLGLLMLPGCDRGDEVVFYTAPKPPPPTTAPAAQGVALQAPAAVDLHWSAPPAWTPLPGQPGRVAGYKVSADDPDAVLTIIAMPESIPLAANVNRWEGQVGLPPTPADRMSDVTAERVLTGVPSTTLDLVGPEKRMLAAIVPHDGRNWYVKLLGKTATVAAQQPGFEALLASLHFATDGHTHGEQPAMADGSVTGATDPAPAASPIAGASELKAYTTPPGWVQDEPKPMRVVSFRTGAGDDAADVLVVRLTAGNVGPLADNVNRWRKEAGLEPAAEEPPTARAMIGEHGAAVYDFTGSTARVRVAYTVLGTDVWFFKLRGPPAAVEQALPAFEAFLASVRFE